MARQPNPILVELYADIAAHTKSECDGQNEGCSSPRGCCHRIYCEAAQRFAKEEYEIDLSFPNPKAPIPFLGPTGCIVAPHLRPVCAIHACCITNLGYKKSGENAQAWTEKYFQLRNAIEELEERSLDDLVEEV